ncbi:glomulin-like [Panonychus citri]|uniref:glomulin-like n=1 Tax=Panonychus citri TaxID=50023 RepID=UPI00230703A0|nr:glomulin-like [Panonychus citri]
MDQSLEGTKKPLEYLSDILEYRDEKKIKSMDIELIWSNVKLLSDQLLENGLPINEREKATVVLLGLLYHPFVYLDLRPSERPDSSLDAYLKIANLNGNNLKETNFNLLTVYSIVKLIADLQEDLFTLIDSIRGLMKTQERIFLEMNLSFGKMLYAVSIISYIGYGLEKDFPNNSHFFPNVFSSQYILIRHLPFLHLLLSQQEENIFDKGLILSVKLFRRLARGSLDSTFLELLTDSPIDNCLIKIMKFSCNKIQRSTALSLFKLFVNSFKLPTRCQLLLRILSNPDSEKGSQRLVLLLYKDLFVYEDDWTTLTDNLNQVIQRSVELSLPQGVNTDLAENFDSICTLLNFIRYLLLRDKYPINESKIWNIIDWLRKDCIDLIWQAIQISKAQYKARLQEMDEPDFKVKGNVDDKFKVEILNENITEAQKIDIIPDISEDHERESLRLGLINLDMMRSLVARINDIIDESTR